MSLLLLTAGFTHRVTMVVLVMVGKMYRGDEVFVDEWWLCVAVTG